MKIVEVLQHLSSSEPLYFQHRGCIHVHIAVLRLQLYIII